MRIHKPRFIPEGGSTVEVLCKALDGLHLLRPGPTLNRLLKGALARAAQKYPVRHISHAALSNHVHLLLWVPDQQRLSRFMEYFKSNLAKEVNRLRNRSGPVWHRRYDSILVTDEEAVQVERLRYILAQGVKEGLVDHVRDWPGVHSGQDLLEGRRALIGDWVDRTRQCRARHKGREIPEEELTTSVELEYAQLPCWADLSWEQYCERVREQIEDIEQQAAVERQREDRPVLGADRVLATDPKSRPRTRPRRPAPRVHAASRKARIAFYRAYGWFVEAYAAAAERLRQGIHPANFPPGSFPPGGPFVHHHTGQPALSSG